MKLFKLSQDINDNYDTYDSVIVCAENEEEARKIHPRHMRKIFIKNNKWVMMYEGKEFNYGSGNWVSCENLDKIKVECLGEAKEGLEKGVILASFNAG